MLDKFRWGIAFIVINSQLLGLKSSKLDRTVKERKGIKEL